MVAATTLAMVFVPMFFIIIEKWSLKQNRKTTPSGKDEAKHGA
jgi:HAE1 family hydrophobic/amphiphilic exporter-1/multidrug efflux pump